MYREICHSIINLDKAIVIVGDSFDGEIYVSFQTARKASSSQSGVIQENCANES